jgi:hypothetical protein
MEGIINIAEIDEMIIKNLDFENLLELRRVNKYYYSLIKPLLKKKFIKVVNSMNDEIMRCVYQYGMSYFLFFDGIYRKNITMDYIKKFLSSVHTLKSIENYLQLAIVLFNDFEKKTIVILVLDMKKVK